MDFDDFAHFKVERAVQAYPSEMSADRSLYADMGVARVRVRSRAADRTLPLAR